MKVKFLIIRFSSIGDIVLTSPVIRVLKQQVEGAEIYFVTKEKHKCLVSSNPYISKIYLLKDKLSTLLEELEKENFDYIIDLHQNIRSNRIKTRLKIPAFAFNKLNYQKWLLVNLNINLMPDLHIVDRYLNTLPVFDVVNDNKGLDYFIDKNNLFDFNTLPSEFKNGYLAFVVAGTYPTKCLPNEKIIEICNRANKPVILLGGKNEIEKAKYIVENSSGTLLNLCGKTALNESAQLIEHAKAVLTNDTGFMHVAAAFKKKILSFWGNTVPELGHVPLSAPSSIKNYGSERAKVQALFKTGL